MVRDDLHTREDRVRHYEENVKGSYPDAKDYATRNGPAIRQPTEERGSCAMCGAKAGTLHQQGCYCGGTVTAR